MTASIISTMAAKKLAAMKQTAVNDPNEKLEDFIVRVHPKFSKPLHLGAALDQLNAIYSRPIRLLLSVPPRHAKSYTVMHLIAQFLARDPTKRVAYITYSAQLSEEFSRKIREFCGDAGVELSTNVKASHHWETKRGGSVDAIGIGGTITGKGFDLLVIDDPHKNREDTESEIIRNTVFETCTSAGLSRLEPGASVIVIHTRWHADDLIGRLSKNTDEGWVSINIKAISDEGEALWPERYDLESLRIIRARNEFDWWSLYMGSPRPRGGAVYATLENQTYEKLPDGQPDGQAIGIDLAYTAKTYSDWSVAVSGLRYGDTIYITDVRRKQCDVKQFSSEIKDARSKCRGAPIWWFVGGVEKGVVTLLRALGIHVNAVVAKTDKYVRAQPSATAWNDGKIKVPFHAPWLAEFLSEVCSFTGVSDAHDDQVDALAALFHPLLGKRLPRFAGNVQVSPF